MNMFIQYMGMHFGSGHDLKFWPEVKLHLLYVRRVILTLEKGYEKLFGVQDHSLKAEREFLQQKPHFKTYNVFASINDILWVYAQTSDWAFVVFPVLLWLILRKFSN